MIGAAANEAERIEGLTKGIDILVVMLVEFVEPYEGELKSLGSHPIWTVGHEVEVFALVD